VEITVTRKKNGNQFKMENWMENGKGKNSGKIPTFQPVNSTLSQRGSDTISKYTTDLFVVY
jgi:hypothetical protein